VRPAPVALLVAVVVTLASRAAPAAPSGADGQELVVFAAASLREVFQGLAASFEQARPNTKVRLNLAGSQELRTQIEQGARADVFASADLKHMASLHKQGLVETPAIFARNQLVIVVPRGNPAGIQALPDLPRARRLVIGAPEVPIGGYTVQIFEAAARKHGAALRGRLEARVVSRELNVRQVLAKVVLGEADAGIVYRTDALGSRDKVEMIAIPAELNVPAEYPVAVCKAAPAPALARAWVDLVRGPEGQRSLTAAGFSTPGRRTGPGTPVSTPGRRTGPGTPVLPLAPAAARSRPPAQQVPAR
jgi:molybdate transport system substrate-binding protein